MFWHYVFSNNSAQIEKLLQKEDVTLTELMDEEDLLQECQAQNKKLVDFLCQDNILQELVSLAVSEPNSDVEYQVRFKHASLAAELLSAEVPAIADKLAASEELLSTLCKILSNDKPLNPLLASFFSKVLSMLIHRRTEQNWYQYQVTCFQVLDFLKGCPDFIPRVAHHIGTSAVMNLLHKLMCGVEDEEVRNRIHAWMRDTPLMSLLISKLGPENEWCEQSSVEQLLCEVLDSGGGLPSSLGAANGIGGGIGGGMAGASNNINNSNNSDNSATAPNANILTPLIMNENVVQQLISLLLHEHGTPSSINHVTNVIMKMLQIHRCRHCSAVACSTTAADQTFMVMQDSQRSIPSKDGEHESAGDSSITTLTAGDFCVVHAIAQTLPQIHKMLVRPTQENLQTSYGECVERVGSTRLRLIALITSLVETRHIKIHQTLLDLNTIPHILDLFFRFPQNNFLHSAVQRCIMDLLTQPAPHRTPSESNSPSFVNLSNTLNSSLVQSDNNSTIPLADTTTSTTTTTSTSTTEDSNTSSDDIVIVHEAGKDSNNKSTASEGDESKAVQKIDEHQSSDVSCDREEKMDTTSSGDACDMVNRTAQTDVISTVNSSAADATNIPSSKSDCSSSLLEQSSNNLQSSSNTTPLDAPKNNNSMFSSENVTSDAGMISYMSDSGDNTWHPDTHLLSGTPLQLLNTDAMNGIVPDEDSHPLLCQLIREAGFLTKILYAYDYKNKTQSDDTSKEDKPSGPPSGSRCGYRGHVRLLANTLAEYSTNGPNAPLLNMLIQSLPGDVCESWTDFLTSTLTLANSLNETSPVPGPELSHMLEDSDDDENERNIFAAAQQILQQNDNVMNMTEDDLQASKDMINAMNYSLSFADNNNDFDTDATTSSMPDTLHSSSGGLDDSNNTLTAAHPTTAEDLFPHVSADEDHDDDDIAAGAATQDDACSPQKAIFEKICSNKHNEDLDSIWSEKEKQITFAKSGESEDACHSSDEDEEDEERETCNRSAFNTSMEIDDLQDDWESVFDRRNSDPSAVDDAASENTSNKSIETAVPITAAAATTTTTTVPVPMMTPKPVCTPPPDAEFNPWQSAPDADTSAEDTSWASFGGASFATTNTNISTDASSDVQKFAAVDFGPTFGGINPFDPFQLPPSQSTAGTTAGAVKLDAPAAATSDPFAFEANFNDAFKQDSTSGGGAGQAVAPAAAELHHSEDEKVVVKDISKEKVAVNTSDNKDDQEAAMDTNNCQISTSTADKTATTSVIAADEQTTAVAAATTTADKAIGTVAGIKTVESSEDMEIDDEATQERNLSLVADTESSSCIRISSNPDDSSGNSSIA